MSSSSEEDSSMDAHDNDISVDECPSDDEDDDDKDSSSWIQELRQAWKQHCVAVIIAILATAAAHGYQRRNKAASSPRAFSSSQGQAPSPYLAHHDDDMLLPHQHLQDYQRTANVSFCSDTISQWRPTERLALMDFHLPKDLFRAMEMHFYADAAQDDFYSNTATEFEPREVTCMRRAGQETSQSFIKGMTFFAKEPSIESMYPTDADEQHSVSILKQKTTTLQPAQLTFTGFAAKFYNLSPKPLLLHWEGKSRRLVGEIAPFESLGTATTPGSSFYVSPLYDKEHALARWVVTAENPVHYYDPLLKDTDRRLLLSSQEVVWYQMQKLNQEFAKHYLIHSGRTWLSHFPRAFPLHPMWETQYIGQVHSVGDWQLKVESVSPKILTIDNFLTHSECDDLIETALHAGLHNSTVYAGGARQRDDTTRSSTNTWLSRDTDSLTDRIYHRAATILQMDPQLFSKPVDDHVDANYHSIAESLQVIRYETGQEYTAHHDFTHASQQHRYQPTRFATLLFYLNDNFDGGATVFPRAVTKDRHDGVRIQPQKGMAVLFYSLLEDGNVDERSQHASQVVVSGEKFAANLWIWEPLIN